MKTKLVRIGNSRGIRLPKAIIEQVGLRENDIELIVRDGELVVRSPSRRRSKKHPRAGWDEAFRNALAELPPDFLEREREEWAEWQNMPNEFDNKEWEW